MSDESEFLVAEEKYSKKKCCGQETRSRSTGICLLVVAILAIFYFTVIGMGLAAAAIRFHDDYNMRSGCHYNTSKCDLTCYFDNGGHFYGLCFLTGGLTLGISLLALILCGLIIDALCYTFFEIKTRGYDMCIQPWIEYCTCCGGCITAYFSDMFSELSNSLEDEPPRDQMTLLTVVHS